MERDDAAKVAEILRANPDGISRAGLMAWARLRIAPDLTDDQLDAALARLGPAVSLEGGFVRLVAPDAADAAGTETRAPGAEGGLTAGGEQPVEWGAGTMSGADDGGSSVEPGAPPAAAFSTVALLGALPSSTEPAPAPSAWVAGSRPRRSIRGLMTIAAFIAIGVIALVGRSGSDGSSAGSTTIPNDPRGSIAAPDELSVGTCFVIPTATEFSELEVRPCDAPHDGEMVSIWDYDAASGAAFPTATEWEDVAGARCTTAFDAYTGQAYADQATLGLGWFTPTEAGWASGDRMVQCYLQLADGSSTSRSYRAGS